MVVFLVKTCSNHLYKPRTPGKPDEDDKMTRFILGLFYLEKKINVAEKLRPRLIGHLSIRCNLWGLFI